MPAAAAAPSHAVREAPSQPSAFPPHFPQRGSAIIPALTSRRRVGCHSAIAWANPAYAAMSSIRTAPSVLPQALPQALAPIRSPVSEKKSPSLITLGGGAGPPMKPLAFDTGLSSSTYEHVHAKPYFAASAATTH